jgi:hypothetical protein
MKEAISEAERYELLVKALLETTVPNDVTSDVAVFHRKGYPGKASGHVHEIDVSIEFTLSGMHIMVLAECKRYTRSVGVDEVLEFAARIDDIGAHKGIIVSTAGFQEGAIRVAISKGIALATAKGMSLVYCSYMSSMANPSLISTTRENRLIEYFAKAHDLSVKSLLHYFEEHRGVLLWSWQLFWGLEEVYGLCHFDTFQQEVFSKNLEQTFSRLASSWRWSQTELTQKPKEFELVLEPSGPCYFTAAYRAPTEVVLLLPSGQENVRLP